ncbi:MAG TPA: pirin family protein [Anaerolineae bacterium]|nr:pirin family protein [Anaerolineae bacterium]
MTPEDYRVLGERDFGAPGLEAIEVIGPFVDIRACGPLITVHDSTVDPHLGIGHHRHRYNERLFYIMAGELDHDDSLNDIQGHMGPGDVGLFTEGKYGMVHSEWNNGDVPALAYILVYTTDPIPEETSFTALRDSEAPRYEESDGVTTKELVGTRSRLRVHGDIRLFTDSELEEGAVLTLTLDDGEGGLLAIRQGEVQVDDDRLQEGATVLVPPAAGVRTLAVRAASAAQIFRAVFGPGHGLVRAADVPAGRR